MALKPDTDAISGVVTTGHEWDGIKELDNPMPAWWIYTFYACIAFAAVWVIFYPSLPFVRGTLGYTGRSDFEAAMDALKINQTSQPVKSPFGFHLIQVQERRAAGLTQERKRMQARQTIKERKAEEAYQDWLRQLRDRTYVEMRLEEK